LRALYEQLARLVVGDQVQLAVPVARARVAESVVLVRRRAQRLGQQRAAVYRQRELPPLGHVDEALYADDVADVEAHHAVVLVLAERILAGDQLNRSRQVAQAEK